MRREDIDKFYKDVEADLKSKLNKASDLLGSIEQKLEETDTNRQQSASSLSTLSKNYDSVMTLISQTRDDLAKVTELRAIALDPESGVESLLAKINSTYEQAEKVNTQILSYDKESQTQSEKIKNDSKVSSENISQIEKLNDQAQTLLKELEKIYQLAINTGLAGSFDERKKRVQEEFVNPWAKKFTWGVIVLGSFAAVILTLSWLVNGFTLEWLTIFRLALLSPLIFYTGYAAVQYSKERRLLEKYAFKAAVAASIDSYTKILTKNFSDKENEEKILNFVLNSMNIVYSEPHEEVKRRRYGFSLGNNLGEMKSEIVEEVGQKVEAVIANKK